MKTQKKQQKRTAILIAAAVLLLIAGGFWFFQSRNSNTTEPAPMPEETVNLDPPSEADKQEAEQKKEELARDPAPTNQNTGTAATVVVTSWGQTSSNFELAARVTNRLEAGGTCTLTLSKGSTQVSATSTASTNVQDTTCGFIKIPLSKLNNGAWSATVQYTKGTVSGSSEAVEVTVQK